MLMVFLLVKKAEDIRTYAWIVVMVPFIGSLVELFLAENKWKMKIPSQLKEIISTHQIIQSIKKHLSPLLLFLMMSCAVTIYTHTDAVMLGLMKTERIVGLYSCAARIKSMLPMLTGALWAAALPKAADLWKQKKTDAFQKLSEKSFHVVYMVMLPLVIYFILFAEPWITIIGGEEYLEAAGTTRLLLLAVIPIGFSNIIGGQMLIATGQEKKLFQAELAGAGSNILLNCILIPYFSAAGAAIATTISETLVTIITLLAIRQQIKVRIFQPANLKRSIIGCFIA